MAKKTWYGGTIKEGDEVICIKGFKSIHGDPAETDSSAEKDDIFKVTEGCMYLDGINCKGVLLGYENPMPSAAWFSNHFSLLT